MDQRIVKPYFWPVLGLSCLALAVTTFFLIGGMVSTRTVAFTIGNFNVPSEDYFIALLVGFVLFLAARTIQNTVNETPTGAIALMFGALVVGGIAVWGMNHALTVTDHVNFAVFEGHPHPTLGMLADFQYWRGISHLGMYRDWASTLTMPFEDGGHGFTITSGPLIALHRAMWLSYGIIAGLAFMVLQVATLFLLFFKTKPEKKAHRH
jgi:hypothetical protein